jgi:type IV secretory pathway VirB10-like protein
MFDDDGAAPVSLHQKIEPTSHSTPIARWVLTASIIAGAGLLAFGFMHWGGGPAQSYVAVASTVPSPSSPLPAGSPTPIPTVAPTPIVRATTPLQPPVRIVYAPQPAAPAAPAAPATDSPEEAARKEDIKLGLEARHQNTVLVFATPGSSAVSGVGSGARPSYTSSCNSGFALCPGDTISGRWDVNVDSGLAGGLLKGDVTSDVSDHTGTNVVIHAGATLIGVAAAVDVAGTARLASAWTEVQDRGYEIPFDATGAGAMGENGLSANVDNHANRAYAQAALYTLIDGAGSVLSNAFARHNSTEINFGTTTQAFAPPSRPAPTLHIIAGTPFTVIVRSRVEMPH